MKKIKFTLLFLLVTLVTFAQESPRKKATGQIDGVTITIDYGSPSVKGRTIWGGLEKYSKVWRAGANENTTFSFDKEVTIGGTSIPAGKYSFFIIPNENKDWILILNKKNDGWGAFSYNKNEDIVRLNVTPKFVDTNQETLTYTIVENGVQLAWGKMRIVLPVN
ncbi:DUF2911 domain-containing protein [Lutibacter sp.]|uniref:DUF2911 domain-containing protein n=1 Tax=Lutibacter sp. TaxID=1925666 RepID=UPI0025BDD723|nr:DUF2911 domain-containing protein [Lutibacter sp.]MCF6167585.1 DUF2911 domain-containing protein [Lutibacter sp.]